MSVNKGRVLKKINTTVTETGNVGDVKKYRQWKEPETSEERYLL